MKILVVGGGGYIGSVTTDLFLQNGYEVVVIDNFSSGYKSPLELLQQKFGADKIRFYDKDISSDLSDIFSKETDIQAVIHFAAFSIVNESMKDPEKYFKNNVCGSVNLLSYLLKANIKNIVFSSTAAVYGEAEYTPIDEDHPTQPTSVYGQTKLIVEQIIQRYQQLLGLNYVIFRYFNVCGASDDGSIGYSITPSSHLTQNAVKGALGIEPFRLTCPKVETKDGTPVRDYIDVVDLARAHLLAAEHLINGKRSEVINLGTGTGSSVMEIIEAVQKATGVKFDLNSSEAREGETAILVASNEKAKKVLGWEPERSLEESIASLVKWYKEHPHGWEN